MSVINLIGQRFGRLLVIDRGTPPFNNKNACWSCVCDCGEEVPSVRADVLKRGNCRSCGCLVREKSPKHAITHNAYGTPEYITWGNMIQRCTNPNHPAYGYYGGRGISVCERWRQFENFLEDMGQRPADLSIDRIDVDGNYEPGNVRWATWSEQMRNRRSRGAA